MNELNGRLVAYQLLAAGLVARMANAAPDPLRFITDFRDEMRAVAGGVRLGGADNESEVREIALRTLDELFALMKPPSTGEQA